MMIGLALSPTAAFLFTPQNSPPPGGAGILAENGDQLQTEASDNLITE